jgi:hypothetical protein
MPEPRSPRSAAKGLRRPDRTRQPFNQFSHQGFISSATSAHDGATGTRWQMLERARYAFRCEGSKRRCGIFRRQRFDKSAREVVPVEGFWRRCQEKRMFEKLIQNRVSA